MQKGEKFIMNTLVNKKHGWGYFPKRRALTRSKKTLMSASFHTLYLFFFAMNLFFCQLQTSLCRDVCWFYIEKEWEVIFLELICTWRSLHVHLQREIRHTLVGQSPQEFEITPLFIAEHCNLCMWPSQTKRFSKTSDCANISLSLE